MDNTKKVLIVAGLAVIAILAYKAIKSQKMANLGMKRLVKGINDEGKGYYPVPYQCYELIKEEKDKDGNIINPKTDEEKITIYNECIKNDCMQQCSLDFTTQGGCIHVDDSGNCLTIPTPEEAADIVAKCSNVCYTDYSTDIQPYKMAIKKLHKRVLAKSKKGDNRANLALGRPIRQKGTNEENLNWAF